MDMLSKPYTLDDCARLLSHWIRGGDVAPDPQQPPAGLAELVVVDTQVVTICDGCAPAPHLICMRSWSNCSSQDQRNHWRSLAKP